MEKIILFIGEKAKVSIESSRPYKSKARTEKSYKTKKNQNGQSIIEYIIGLSLIAGTILLLVPYYKKLQTIENHNMNIFYNRWTQMEKIYA